MGLDRSALCHQVGHFSIGTLKLLVTQPLFDCSIVRAGDAIYVRVGDHDLTQKYGSPGAQTLRVATTYIHHNHNSQTLDNDIAILKLHGEADLKEGVCLVCLPARGTSQSAGKKCTVTGYGYMGESKIFSNVQSHLIKHSNFITYFSWSHSFAGTRGLSARGQRQ